MEWAIVLLRSLIRLFYLIADIVANLELPDLPIIINF